LPDFFLNIDKCKALVLSKYGKRLKPDDLATEEQRANLLYVLDVFPGLYCRQVEAGDVQSVTTLTEPRVLVTFANSRTAHKA
jgi:hypothetical protein